MSDKMTKGQLLMNLREGKKFCLEVMQMLVLANVGGEKMDVITDIARKAVRFGAMTDKQHLYVQSLIARHHLDAALKLIHQVEMGEDVVAQAPVPPPKPYEPAPRFDQAVSVTDSNPLLGMF